MICDHDTIAAPATAAGGALAVIRVSGSDALTICDRIFRGSAPLADAGGYTVHYGHIMADGRTLDDVLVTVFRAPRSYTGEDAAEISCHGSQYIVSETLRLLTAAGAAILWGAAQPLGVMFASWQGFGLCTALGIVTCYLPYLLYTFGLSGLETGKASILASFEPVVATLVGIFVFHETLTPLSALGCVCVLSAVVLLNLKRRQKAN